MLFEIHITIESNNIEQFKLDCKNLNVKPILIDTIKDTTQLMSSSKHNSANYKLVLDNLTNEFKSLGYNILRKKVEKFPNKTKDKDFIYYESHLRLKLPKQFNNSNLLNECNKLNFHVSKNLFKTSNEFDYQMITYRNYNLSFNKFNQQINKMKRFLTKENIDFDKIEIEECIFDSNEKIDKNWLSL